MPDLLTFEKLFTPATMAEYVKERKVESNTIDLLFPSIKDDEETIRNIKGANGLPVTATIHADNTSTQVASRDGFSEEEIGKVLIKRQIQLKEHEINKLNNPRTSREFERIKKTIFDDAENMAKAVEVRAKALAAEALHSGKIVVNENGAKFTIDYGKNQALSETLAGTSLWSDASAKPLVDIFNWVNKTVELSGVKPSRALVSSRILALLLQNESIKKAIFGVNFDKMLTIADLNALMVAQQLPKLATFDDMYRVQDTPGKYQVKRYIPDNKIILMPEGNLGNSVWGPTAEEYELIGATGVDAYADNHLTITIYRTPDPVSRWTKATGKNIPSFEAADEVFVGTVL